MRILWAKSGGLVPLDHGGKIRSFHLAKQLASRHDVTLFTFYPANPHDTHRELESIFSRVIALPLAIPQPRSAEDQLRYLRNLLSARPYSVSKYCQPSVREHLQALLEANHFDVIVCDFLLTAAVVPWDISIPKVLFTHNIEALIWQRHYQVGRNLLWKAACYREFRTMETMERKYIQRADHILAVSEFDRNFFAQMTDPKKISVIPTGVDIDFFRPAKAMPPGNTLIFTGSMDWLPNEDGIIYFVKEILPKIRVRCPDVELRIVGRRPTIRLRRFAEKHAGVEVTGDVDDIRPHLHAGKVYIVPLRVGGGTRLKIFEAMAAGKAIVSTTIGAEGLPIHPGEDILLADEPNGFAEAVIELLHNVSRRESLERSARNLVESRYSWCAVGATLDSVLRRIVTHN